MEIAVAVGASGGLGTCLRDYQTAYPDLLHWTAFDNSTNFLEAFVPGRYDALLFDALLRPTDLAEIRQRDSQLRLVPLVPTEGAEDLETQGMWGFLPSPLQAVFVRGLLDRLQQELTVQDKRSIVLKTRGRVLRLPFADIEYVEVLGHDIAFHLTDGRQERLKGTLSQWTSYLQECPTFVKTHRSYLVNLACVQQLTKEGVLTQSGAFVPVSVGFYPQLKKYYLQNLMILPAEEQQEGPADTHAPHILLVDDEAAELDRWSAALLSHGCTVATAQQEEDALALLTQARFDCVILDVQLGHGSGFELHQRIKHLTRAPILYLSTLSDEEHQTQGFQGGGVDYITKDTGYELFWFKVKSRLASNTAPLGDIASGRLTLQLGARTATVGGSPLPLTGVEFNLLHLFMQHPMEVYAPSQLYQRIWGNDMRDNGQTIQLHLFSLAEKLSQASPQHRYIEAVWGKGYRFVPDKEGGGKG